MAKKPLAALLETPDQERTFHITVETNSGARADMKYTSKLMAQQEYNRIRSQGVFCGEWIKFVDYWDSKI